MYKGAGVHFADSSPLICGSATDVYFLAILTCIIELWLSVKAVTLIFISELGSTISSAKQRKSGSIYNLVKN